MVQGPVEATATQVAAFDAYGAGRLRERYDSSVIDDAALERERHAGTLTVDTRLRDALRTLRDDTQRATGTPAMYHPRQALRCPILRTRRPTQRMHLCSPSETARTHFGGCELRSNLCNGRCR